MRISPAFGLSPYLGMEVIAMSELLYPDQSTVIPSKPPHNKVNIPGFSCLSLKPSDRFRLGVAPCYVADLKT